MLWMSEPCNTNSSPILVNTSKIVSSFFITSSHLHCCVSNVCVEVSVVFALKEMAMIFLVLWTGISSSSPLSLPLSSSLLLPSSPFYVQVHVYSTIRNTCRYMHVYMYRILPKISPPFFSSRHDLDWGGGLFSNMHFPSNISPP